MVLAIDFYLFSPSRFITNPLPMLTNVEHLGIAVKSIAVADVLFSKLLNTLPYKHELVATEGVNTSFFQINQTKIELLEATHPDSPIAKFIEKKGKAFIM